MLDIKSLSLKSPEEKDNLYSYISPDVLWSCTTCNACVEQCPVLIEHVDTIVDMRRGLLQSNMAPSNLQATLKNVKTKSNPWGLDPNDREKWIQELKASHYIDVKLARNYKNNFEYLYWVGSPGAFDDRNKDVTKAMAQLMVKAGVDFAVLGNEEKSSGDIARRAGDEGLFQEIVIENIELLKIYGVKKIITQCPHVYNSFKNEYPEFGLEGVEIYHHSEFLAMLIQEGKLKPEKSVDQTVTYHDPSRPL
jgi:Fe-S oxidoreductase